MYDATLEGLPIRKSTALFSNADFTSMDKLCDGGRVHLQLQGSTAGAPRIARAAVYQLALCQATLDVQGACAGVAAGGRSITDFSEVT